MRLSECLLALMLLAPSGALAENRAPPPEGARAMADAHFRRGSELFQQKAFREALLEFQRAYAIAPDSNLLQSISQTKVALQSDVTVARRETKPAATARERPPVVSITLTFHHLELDAQTVRTLSQLAQARDEGRALSIVLEGLGGKRAPVVVGSTATVAQAAQAAPSPEAPGSTAATPVLAATDAAGKKARVVRGIDELDPYSAAE